MDFANWGVDQPRVPKPDPAEKGVRFLIFKAPRRVVRVADSATQTPTGGEDFCVTKKARAVYAAHRAARVAVACGSDDATEEEDSVMEEEDSGVFSDPAEHRAEYLRVWAAERAGLRKVAQAFGRHWEAKKRAERGAKRRLPRGHLVALVAEEDDAQQELWRQSAEFGDLTDYAEWLGGARARPSTPASERRRLKCHARREAALLPHLPAMEETARRRISAEERAAWAESLQLLPGAERCARGAIAAEEDTAWVPLVGALRLSALPLAERSARRLICSDSGGALCLALARAEGGPRGALAAQEHERRESLRKEHAAATTVCGRLSGLADCGPPLLHETRGNAWSGTLSGSSLPVTAEQFATQHGVAAREAEGGLLGVQGSLTHAMEGSARKIIGAEETEAWLDLHREMLDAIAVQAGRDCVARAFSAPSWSKRNDFEMVPFAASSVAPVSACTHRLWLTAGEAPLRLLGGEHGARGAIHKEQGDAWADITQHWYEVQEAKRRAELLELVRLVDELTAPGRESRDAGTLLSGERTKLGCGVPSGAPEKAARPPVRLPQYLPPPTYGWWVSGAARYQRGTPFPYAVERPPWA